MSSNYPIQSAEHALLAGYVWGVAMQHGLDLVPEVDAQGNYMASVLLDIPGLRDGLTVRLIVAPPTDDLSVEGTCVQE